MRFPTEFPGFPVSRRLPESFRIHFPYAGQSHGTRPYPLGPLGPHKDVEVDLYKAFTCQLLKTTHNCGLLCTSFFLAPLKMSRSCWAFLMLVAAPISALVAHPLAGRASSPTLRLRGGNGEIDRTMVGKVPDGVETLKQRFGGAPDAELGRFLAKQRGDVEKAASVYAEALKWRDARKGQAVAGVENVPEWMWKFETGRARDNTTVLWVQGAMYDSRAADGAAYVEKTVRLLERMLPTDSHD